MDKITTLSLDEHSVSFVESKVSEGTYRSASEAVQAGLRLLEEQDTRLAALRSALIEGEASGEALPFDVDLFLARRRGAAGNEP